MDERAVKRRDPGIAWALSIITLGIYFLFWYYLVNRELSDDFPDVEVSPLGAVAAVTVGGLIVVPPFVSTYNTGRRIRVAQRAAGVEPTCRPWVGLLLMFVLGLHVAYYQLKLNTVADELEVSG
jgi:hypothetical protein